MALTPPTMAARCLLRAVTVLSPLLLSAAPALAQGEEWAWAVPTELSVGLGATSDRGTKGTSANVNLGLSWIHVRDQWIEPALEMGFGPTSDEALCQDPDNPAPGDTCIDGYALMGVRSHLLRKSDRTLRPFIHFLVGGYWKGSGVKEPDLLPGTFALQTGGGIDIRKATSIHGLRVAGDYRRVFDDGRARHQLQFVVSYFLGWRGQQPKAP